jgi:Tfp pilus assembly protein PilF
MVQLLQAAGKVEERLGNIARARDLYSSSLSMEPSAPTLVAYAMLELRHTKAKPVNRTIVRRLFEEALLLDRRHGPAYNAYGNMELKTGNVKEARAVFERGVHANCTDVASVYHGLAQLELRLGNLEVARDVLKRGLLVVQQNAGTMDTNQRGRAVFLAHTLGTLELNTHRPLDAKVVFEEGIVRHGNSSQLLLGAALCEGRLGNEDTARELFERAVKADSKHAQAWQAWGVMEMRAGRIKVAKTLFECGIQTRPTHGALWHAYGECKQLTASTK